MGSKILRRGKKTWQFVKLKKYTFSKKFTIRFWVIIRTEYIKYIKRKQFNKIATLKFCHLYYFKQGTWDQNFCSWIWGLVWFNSFDLLVKFHKFIIGDSFNFVIKRSKKFTDLSYYYIIKGKMYIFMYNPIILNEL